MGLMLQGKWGLVCGADEGLGFGYAQALVQESVKVLLVALGRGKRPAHLLLN